MLAPADIEIEEHRRLLASQESEESEWWYYHGHLQSSSRRFAFHLAFFRFRIDDICLAGLLPLKFAARHFRVAHFAVTELDGGQFHYGFRRSLLGDDAGASAVDFRTWIGDWSAHHSSEGGHVLAASIRQAQIQLVATPLKRPLLRMHGGDGLLSCRVAGGEICFTRMHANGVLRLDELEIAVNGTAWMEREFGNFPLKHDIHGWDWFAIQFENGTELRLYHLRGHSRLASDHSSLAFIDEAGAVTWLGAGECSLQSKALWTSARTGIEYPTQWLIEAPGLRCSLCVSASLCCNELDTRGSSNVIYWEGPAIVSGQLQGSAVSGRSFVELVGYDVSQRPSGVFDFTTNRLGLWDSVFNEFRQHLHGPGVSISED